MNRFNSIYCLLAGLLLLSSACREQRKAPDKAAASATNTLQSFAVKGVVKGLRLEKNEASIKHEEIPNYMPAMTMPFKVKEARWLTNLAAGDEISFRLNVTDDESWIDDVRKTGAVAPTPPPPAERPSQRIARDVPELMEGDLMPDYPFTNDVGKNFRLSDFKGKAIAFTFIFTRCPIPEFCPLMSRNFLDLYKRLKATPGAPTNWHLLSISFDPHFDTPAVLERYGKLYPHDRADWDFATSAMIEIDAITDQFGLVVMKQGENWEHKLRTVVVDAAGRIQKIYVGNAWKPEEIYEEMVKAAKATAPVDPAK